LNFVLGKKKKRKKYLISTSHFETSVPHIDGSKEKRAKGREREKGKKRQKKYAETELCILFYDFKRKFSF